MVAKQYLLIVESVNQFKHIAAKVKFINPFKKWLKKLRIVKKLKNCFKGELTMSKENERHFRKANTCHICNKSKSEKNITIRDHYHRKRGSANQIA